MRKLMQGRVKYNLSRRREGVMVAERKPAITNDELPMTNGGLKRVVSSFSD